MPECVFCKNIPRVMENNLAYAVFDINPISTGHALVIIKRHIEQIFDATIEEWAAMRELVMTMKDRIQAEHAPDGYNVWVNCGRAAGQVVMHAHIHLIPRYNGQAIQINPNFVIEHLKGNIK